MVNDAVLKECEKIMQERLRRYDVMAFEEMQNIEPFGCDSSDRTFQIFESLINQRTESSCVDDSIPEDIRYIVQAFRSNVQMLNGNIEEVYMADIYRAIAYHDYVENFTLKQEEIKQSWECEFKELTYLPVNPQIRIKQTQDKSITVGLSIGGGMLDFSVLEGTLKNIFLGGTDRDGNYKERAKGIDFELYKKMVRQVTDQKLDAADIWFLKNTIDPELIIGLVRAIENTNKRNSDKQLIEILCQCQCPSVRLYIFEAVKPSYLYIRKNFSSGDKDYMNILFAKLKEIIGNINHRFGQMVWTKYRKMERDEDFKKNVAEIYKRFEERFQQGDDFQFLLDGDKRRRMHGASIRYYDFLEDKNGDIYGKVAYDVIAALHGRREYEEEIKKEIVQWQQSYCSRLYLHVAWKKDINENK